MEVGDFHLLILKPRYDTQGLRPISFQLAPKGLSPSLAGLSRPLWLSRREGGRAHTPHSPRVSPRSLVWTFPLSLRLIRESLLVSFPPLIKMFQFGGFPLLTEHHGSPKGSAVGGPIEASTDLRLHAPTRGFSQLATPFFSAQA